MFLIYSILILIISFHNHFTNNNLIKIPTRLSTYNNSLIGNILKNSNQIVLNLVINTDILPFYYIYYVEYNK